MKTALLLPIVSLLAALGYAEPEPGCGHLIFGKKAAKFGIRPNLQTTLEGASDTDATHYTLNFSLNPPSTNIVASTQIEAESKSVALT